MVTSFWGIVSFVIGVLISTVIIYFATKLFREKEGIKHALITAIIGAIVYSVVYFLLGSGFWAALAAGVIWLLVLRAMYRIGWLKAIVIAIVVWIAGCSCRNIAAYCTRSTIGTFASVYMDG